MYRDGECRLRLVAARKEACNGRFFDVIALPAKTGHPITESLRHALDMLILQESLEFGISFFITFVPYWG